MCPNHSLYVQRPYARSMVSFPVMFCVFVIYSVLLYIVRVSPNERTRHFVKYMKMALQAYLVLGSGKKIGVLGYFRQEIDCFRPKYDQKLTFFNGFWPFNAKIRVASGEEYWGPLGKSIGAA